MRASWRSSSLKAVSMTRCADAHVCEPLPERGFGPVSPVKTHQPAAPPSTAKPTAGTVCEADSTSIRLPFSSRTSPTASGTSDSIGCSALGRRVKSGQMTPLKMCVRSAASVSGSAWTWIGGRGVVAPRAHHAVGQQADRQDVVEVRVADQDVLDPRQCVERHVAHARAGVDQDVVVDEERGGLCSRLRWSRSNRGPERSWSRRK